MDSVNVEVLRCAANWIEAGIAVTLATVLKTWFSLPCVPAAQLAISGDGRLVGSVSGGCIEDDLIETGTPTGDAVHYATFEVTLTEAASSDSGAGANAVCGAAALVLAALAGANCAGSAGASTSAIAAKPARYTARNIWRIRHSCRNLTIPVP